MSVQFGRWHFEGDPIGVEYLQRVRSFVDPYGPDGGDSFTQGNITILFRAFHTTIESTRERQPHISTSGKVLVWDGRLDNRDELIAQLREVVSTQSTDVLIVAAAFERWNTRCFAKLLGDW